MSPRQSLGQLLAKQVETANLAVVAREELYSLDLREERLTQMFPRHFQGSPLLLSRYARTYQKILMVYLGNCLPPSNNQQGKVLIAEKYLEPLLPDVLLDTLKGLRLAGLVPRFTYLNYAQERCIEIVLDLRAPIFGDPAVRAIANA